MTMRHSPVLLRRAWLYLRHRIAPGHPSTRKAANLALPGIEATVEVLFDAYGVPHIQAETEPDLFFGLGYMHGRDRRFQMEIMRAMAEGSLRALFDAGHLSKQIVEQEVLCRTLGFQKRAEQYVSETASEEDLALLRSYCAGVNAATLHEPLPIEFQLLDIVPRPWTQEVPVALAQMLAFGLCKNWEMELARLEIALYQRMKGHPFERAFQIWPTYFDFPPHLIEPGDGYAPIPTESPGFGEPLVPELAAYLEQFAKTYEPPGQGGNPNRPGETVASMAGVSSAQGGSNNWAIHGTRTRSGSGALAADPHLPLSLPSPGYLAHLQCRVSGGAGYALIGAGFVGIPGIFFGSNGQVAWGMTANWADVTDLYVERADPSRLDCYEYEGECFPFDLSVETFQIRRGNSFDSETRQVRHTRHGPLLNDVLSRLPAGFPLVSLKRAEKTGNPFFSLRTLYKARSCKEAAAAISGLDLIVGHWALADRDGDIAYQASGSIPRRLAHRGTFPVPGWKKKYDWDGWMTGSELPCRHNPAQGVLVTANNQVVAPGAGGFYINDDGDVAYRTVRLQNALMSKLDATASIEPVQFSRDMQLDGIEPLFAEILPLWKPALELLRHDADRDIADAARRLLAWDGNCTPESVPAALFQGVCVRLFNLNLGDEMPSGLLRHLSTYFNAEPLVHFVLTARTLPGWNSGERIKECLRSTVKCFRVHYGNNLQKWQWQIIAPFALKHPLGGHPLLRRFVNRGLLPTRGAHNALNKQYTSRLDENCFAVLAAAALRVNIDLSDFTHSMMCVLGGQSGRPGSQHYDDQIAHYVQGAGVSMEMDFDRIRQNAIGSLTLRKLQTYLQPLKT